MKATIDFDDALYRRLKVEAARRGQTVRELVAEGVRLVLAAPPRRGKDDAGESAWFGSLQSFAPNARAHDLASIRASIGRGRRGTRK